MTRLAKTLLLVVWALSTATNILFIMFGIYDQIMGSGKAEQFLKKTHIPLSYSQVFIIGIISVALSIATYALLNKLFKKS